MQTRTKRYATKRGKTKTTYILRKTSLKLFKSIVYILVGIIFTIYSIVKAFDTFVGKQFMRLPRLLKVAIVYFMIINIGVYGYYLFNKNDGLMLRHLPEFAINVENINTTKGKLKECTYDDTSCKIYFKAKELGLNEEQTLISIAISKWETGNYTSKAFKELNNVGGMMGKSGLMKFDSLDIGISKFLENLKVHYFDIGLNTLEEIQRKYCPIGAKNDPNDLNKNWLGGTKKMYNELISK